MLFVIVVLLSSASDSWANYNNNNNNNNNNLVSHCESSRGSRDECRIAPDGCRPLHQADRLEP